MDVVQQQLFRELWPELQESLTLNTSINSLLDYLKTKNVDISPNHYHLVNQNVISLFLQLGEMLGGKHDGYDILIAYVKKDSLRWLYDKYTNQEREHQAKQRAIEKALKYGNVPMEPMFYIQRQSMMQKIKSLVSDMSNWAINIFGMDGIGKTNLIAACLREPDILAQANYKVYWIDLKRYTEGELLDRMYKLFHKIQIDDVTLSDLPTEMPANVELMKVRLQNVFTRSGYDKAIIVLDNVDVNDAMQKVIEYFGVCRMVIVSRERFVLDHVRHMPLQDAFTTRETMEVFCMALGTTYGDMAGLAYNEHLSAIIEWCRGDLTTTILCAKLMVERKSSLTNRANSDRVWERFRQELCKNNSEVTTKRNTTIEMRLRSLDTEMLDRYKNLAVFVNDVNITPHVLSLLWGIVEVQVEKVMKNLCNMSFAVSGYNEQHDTDVYGVNHNYLNYLRMHYERSSLKLLHANLIQAYKDKYTHYHKFVNDNYIYQYIGYHLQEAGLLDDFKIYRDLKFIEAKIRAAGIRDMLLDFEIYFDQITRQDEKHEMMLGELRAFVERFGMNLENYPHTSILQSALQLPKENLVHRLALQELKTSDQFGLYFDWLLPKKNTYYIHNLPIKVKLEVACFTYDDPAYLLVGTEEGDILLLEPKYENVLQEFKGHISRITYIRAAENKFLSISDDGILNVWKLDYNSRRNSAVYNTYNDNANLPSPAHVKQRNHQNFFGNNFATDNYVTYEAAKDDKLISADFSHDLLVAGSRNGKLMLWDEKNQTLEEDLSHPITAVLFSNDFNYIYAALKTDVVVYSKTQQGFKFRSKSCFGTSGGDIITLHTLPSDNGNDNVDEVIVVMLKQVIIHNIKSLKKTIIMTTTGEYTCSSMTDQYLVIGSTENKIYMWGFNVNKIVAKFDTQYGRVICLDTMTNSNDHTIEILLTGYHDRSLKLWHVNPEETAIQEAQNVDAFAAYWQSDCKKFATAMIRQNKLTISDSNDTFEVETVCDVVKVVNFKNSFVCADKNGSVHVCHNWGTSTIMKLKNEISYLEALDNMVVAATASGVLFVYTDSAHKLRDESRPGWRDDICCSFNVLKKLLVVSQRKISYWNYWFLTEEVLYAAAQVESNFRVACVFGDEKLCVTFEKSFKVIHFDTTMETQLKISSCFERKTQEPVTSCCFSSDGKYLALGTETGDIEVFDTERLALSSILKLHKSPVHFLKFSHEVPILLSLAEQMAWWNVNLAARELAQNPPRRSFRSRSNSGKSPGKKPPPLENLLADIDLSDVVMWTKRGRSDKEYLLAAIKLHGQSASHIACADGFRAFLSIDNLGNLYNLRMIEDPCTLESPYV
ncbi:apoptotic protease-activating factor 1 isoform X2 [Atheta coriaria]|uniref:apoptotic protease-activating factor 1 isoform X2 n=1 Tax=Dalotia coriaria TaxID=877792 RepID=UPI0031F3AAF9